MRARVLAAATCAVVAVVGIVVFALAAAGTASVAVKPGPRRPSVARRRGRLVYGFNGEDATGRIVNLTPYAWTFVAKEAPHASDWGSDFPKTLEPGQTYTYELHPYNHYATTSQYYGWFTYRADTLSHAEYLSIDLYGSHCTGLCLDRDGPALSIEALNRTRAPSVNRFGQVDWGPKTPNQEIGWTASGNENVFGFPHPSEASFDFTFQTKGNYTVDAAKAPPQLADLLNAMCAGATGTKCSFSTNGEISWGIGALDEQAKVKSCDISHSGPATTGVGIGDGAPAPSESPDWHEVTVEAKRTHSVSVGGSITGSTELNILDTIDAEVSLKIGIEHEWADTSTFSKTTRVYVPQGWIAGVWTAPVVGKVTGTLVVSTELATYTITNFEETASGVSKDLTTPAFDIMTYARAMTPEEIQRLCPKAASADRRASARRSPG